MDYKKGLHIVCDLEQVEYPILSNMSAFKVLIEDLINKHKLTSTGAVYHQFNEEGYTAVIGLTESHFSIHTWPEFGRLTYDIFLSNFMQVNDGKCENISAEIQLYFGGKVTQIHRIER